MSDERERGPVVWVPKWLFSPLIPFLPDRDLKRPFTILQEALNTNATSLRIIPVRHDLIQKLQAFLFPHIVECDLGVLPCFRNRDTSTVLLCRDLAVEQRHQHQRFDLADLPQGPHVDLRTGLQNGMRETEHVIAIGYFSESGQTGTKDNQGGVRLQFGKLHYPELLGQREVGLPW